MKKLLFGCMPVLLVTGMASATRTMFLNHTSGTCTPYLDTGTLTANWYNNACGSKTTAWTSNSGWTRQPIRGREIHLWIELLLRQLLDRQR